MAAYSLNEKNIVINSAKKIAVKMELSKREEKKKDILSKKFRKLYSSLLRDRLYLPGLNYIFFSV